MTLVLLLLKIANDIFSHPLHSNNFALDKTPITVIEIDSISTQHCISHINTAMMHKINKLYFSQTVVVISKRFYSDY